jgi:hypothetical protein
MAITNVESTTEVLYTEKVVSETDASVYVVEVYRRPSAVVPVVKDVAAIDIVRPGGTVVNVGAGPALPENPYEGQIWIKI